MPVPRYLASASRSLLMICSGECRLRFIEESPVAPAGSHRDSHRLWFCFWGAGQRIGWQLIGGSAKRRYVGGYTSPSWRPMRDEDIGARP